MRLVNYRASRPQVLLVEDDAALLEVIQAAIERQGYTFETARNAEEALEKAYRLQPEVVLLDINLPDQSGYLVAAKLKLAKSSPKVVFMTAMPRGEADRLAAFVRADGVMHKPFAVRKMISTVDRLLGLAHAA